MKKDRLAYVYTVPSATFHYTEGDSRVYLNFVDRGTTISYKKSSKTGKTLINRIKKYGYSRVSFPK